MAKIVLGLATSHSPMLCVPSKEWVRSYGAKDQHDPSLGHYQELYRQNASRLEPQIILEACQERYEAVQRAMDTMAETLQRVAPDTVVVIGDDHHECFPKIICHRSISTGEKSI
jgi:3-O-methylgallate 3,4-dioxygenase